MKIVISYFEDGREESDIKTPDAMYVSHSIESAEETLGKLERYLHNRKWLTPETEKETNF